MNDGDIKSENRKARLMLAVATIYAATPESLRNTQADIDLIVDRAFDLESRVTKRLEGQ